MSCLTILFFLTITIEPEIYIVYDANGNKLQRKYTPDGGATMTTTYINEFVYQDDALSYINFEEGRIRLLTPVSTNNGFDGLEIDGNIDLPNGKRGAFDFFIRDYQQNVRMILTQETHYGINEATMEQERAASEEPYFGQQGSSNEVATTRFAKPAGWNANTSNSVSKLSKLTGHTVGPNVLLKVMAGDQFNAMADYYYQSAVTNNQNSLIPDIVAGLVQAITGSPSVNPGIHSNTTNISTDLNASIPFSNIADPDKATVDNIPRAYLNIMFFNERFEFVEEGSMALRVSQPGDGAAPLVLSNIKAPKNGYVYIYLSNENDDAVFWDNFTVSFTRGRIIEENHYYAFGLRIAGISSVKFGDVHEGSLKNDYLYQGDFAELDRDIGWHDFALRNYDAQLGRFVQADPFGQFPGQYTGMGNDPVNTIDPSGGWAATGLFKGMSRFGIMATTTLGGAMVGGAIDLISGGDGGKGLLIGAGIGLASNFSTNLWVALTDPTVELISGGFKKNYLGANLDATFKVRNVKASGLQIIQTLNGPDEPPNIETLAIPHHYGKFSKVVNGVRIGGFVDGGINSLQVRLGQQPANNNSPYYLNEGSTSGVPPGYLMKYSEYVHWKGTRGTIRVQDIPRLLVGEANFETIIIAKNYRGSGKDKILAHFSWGTIDMVGTRNIDFEKNKGGIDLNVDANISELSREIIKFDYPYYEFY